MTAVGKIDTVDIYHLRERRRVATTARLFMTGRSQAVRLPKSMRFEGTEVIAKRFGNGVLLLPIDAPWSAMQEALFEFEPGFRIEREQPTQAPRKDWP